MEKLVEYPNASICLRKMRTQEEWKVLTQMLSAPKPTSLSTRSRISPAALLVNVMAMMFHGLTSFSSIR